MGEKICAKLGPRFFDMPLASGYMGATYFPEFKFTFQNQNGLVGVETSAHVSRTVQLKTSY